MPMGIGLPVPVWSGRTLSTTAVTAANPSAADPRGFMGARRTFANSPLWLTSPPATFVPPISTPIVNSPVSLGSLVMVEEPRRLDQDYRRRQARAIQNRSTGHKLDAKKSARPF